MNRGIAVIRGRFVWKCDENTKTLQSLDTSIQKPAVLVTDEIVVLSLFPRDETWCLHSSPKKKSGVSSLITKGEKWCLRLSPTTEQWCLRHHQRRNKSVFVYHELWNTGVFAVTNKGKLACLRLSPTMDKCCVSACHEGRKEHKDPDIIICHWNITWSVNTTVLFRNHTRCFASLDPSAGAYRLEIYRWRSNWETWTQREEETTRAREEFGDGRSMAQKGGGGWDLDASARKSNNKSYIIKQYCQCWDVRG